MLVRCLSHLQHRARRWLHAVGARLLHWAKPLTSSLAGGMAADLSRSKQELVLENALLRQQLVVLNRSVKRPALTATDRGLLVLLVSRLRTWTSALIIVKPETVLRWHRQGLRLFWRRTSRPPSRTPRIPAETVALIRQMAAQNRLWGAERIRGGTAQARPPRQQAHDPEVHAPGPPTVAAGADLGHFRAQPCAAALGL